MPTQAPSRASPLDWAVCILRCELWSVPPPPKVGPWGEKVLGGLLQTGQNRTPRSVGMTLATEDPSHVLGGGLQLQVPTLNKADDLTAAPRD